MGRTDMITLEEIPRHRHEGGLTVEVSQVLRKIGDVGIGWPLPLWAPKTAAPPDAHRPVHRCGRDRTHRNGAVRSHSKA